MHVVSHSYQGGSNLIYIQNTFPSSIGALEAQASWKLRFMFMLDSF